LKYIAIGMVLSIISSIIGAFTGWSLFYKIIGIAAIVPLILSGLLTGAFVGGDRNRANYHTTTKEDRHTNNEWAFRLFLIGLPNLIIVIIFVVLSLTG
jgi:hypothetical protein